jgi:hypothetical protein
VASRIFAHWIRLGFDKRRDLVAAEYYLKRDRKVKRRFRSVRDREELPESLPDTLDRERADLAFQDIMRRIIDEDSSAVGG